MKILLNNHKAVVVIGLTATTRQNSKLRSILLGKINQTSLVGTFIFSRFIRDRFKRVCLLTLFKVVGKKWPQLWPDGGTRGTVLSEHTEGEQELCKYVAYLTQF